MLDDIIITVNEHSVRNIYGKKINYAYSNNIMNHNNAEYVKEIIYECTYVSEIQQLYILLLIKKICL